MKTKQTGFSLIEALVALLVLSIGLVGMAALQTRALIDAQQSYLDSVATLAAVDAQERLWVKLGENRDCSTIALAEISEDWEDSWFNGSDSPLKNKTGNVEENSEDEDNCDFIITINVSDDPFKFFIRLPKL